MRSALALIGPGFDSTVLRFISPLRSVKSMFYYYVLASPEVVPVRCIDFVGAVWSKRGCPPYEPCLLSTEIPSGIYSLMNCYVGGTARKALGRLVGILFEFSHGCAATSSSVSRCLGSMTRRRLMRSRAWSEIGTWSGKL